MTKMPAGFVAHSAPTLALDARKGADLSRWARSLPITPSAILIVSAHWEAAPPTLSSTRPGTPLVYDFGGFDEALYRIRHDAPPISEELATRIQSALARWSPRRSDRGLDHGAWVPLRHIDPEARIPTVQLSMPRTMSGRELFELGRALAPFRNEGVWILGSGNLTHNLGRLDFSDRSPPEPWARQFDRWAEERLRAGDLDALLEARSRAPAFEVAHPTDEHWRPLLVALGAAEDDLGRVTFPVSGFEYANLSRRCVQIG